MQTVLSIAGFDPSSGAGVTADLMVFAAHGLFGISAITSLTVQSTTGVRASHPVPAALLRATLACLQDDLPPAGVKIGMLATSENVTVVADYLEALRAREGIRVPVVLDPVMRSSSGRELLDAHGVLLMRERLLPLVDWVTPNLEELAVLAGVQVRQRGDVADACLRLQAQYTGRLGVFATGGHLAPPDDYFRSSSGEEVWLPGVRVETRSTHGTGCALSSSFLSFLALGQAPEQAAADAKQYVARAMHAAEPRGAGCGPMQHLWPLRPPADV